VWNGIFILPDGYVRLCSIGRYADPNLDFQRARDKNGVPMHILTHELIDIINSDKHREVRLLNKSSDTAWSPHCDCCEVREKVTDNTHNFSRRMFLLNVNTKHVDAGDPISKLNSDGSVPWMPSSLDINFGNLCNQKCIMCNPAFSNQWYNEWFDYWKTDKFGQSEPIKANYNIKLKRWESPEILKWHENPIWWEKFEQMAPYLRHIYVTGGEPMVTPSHDEMLDRLIDRGLSKNIWLEYDTNATVINDKLISRWEKFKKIVIRASMDGTDKQYEVIRFPGKWDIFKNNIEKLKKIKIDSKNKIALTALTSCFQISNSFSQVEADTICKELEVPYHIRFLEGPMFMSTESFSDNAKDELIEYYKPHRIAEYVNFMNYLDKTRNLNWREVFPKVSALINKHY
jgi:organic radical activating enzyme